MTSLMKSGSLDSTLSRLYIGTTYVVLCNTYFLEAPSRLVELPVYGTVGVARAHKRNK